MTQIKVYFLGGIEVVGQVEQSLQEHTTGSGYFMSQLTQVDMLLSLVSILIKIKCGLEVGILQVGVLGNICTQLKIFQLRK